MAEGAVPAGDIQTPDSPDIVVTARRAAARPDPLSRLGISSDLLQKYTDAQDERELVSNRAQQAVQNNMQRRENIMAQPIERPEKPQLDELPAPPEMPEKNPLRVFGEFLPVLAMLGGAASRYSATAALDAGTAAVKAARANDDAALEKADKEWNRQMDFTIKSNSTRLDQYRAALDDTRLSMDERLANLNALAAANQDQVLLSQLAAGDVTSIANAIQVQANALKQISDNYYKARELQNAERELQIKEAKANGTLSGFSLSALKGADLQQMKDIQAEGNSARYLSNMAQQFMEYNKRAATAPGAGFLQYFGNQDIGAMTQLSSRMSGNMRPPGSGATSDYEQRLYKQGVPQVDLPYAVNEARAWNLMQAERVATLRQQFMEEFAMRNRTLGGGQKALEEFTQTPEYQELMKQGVRTPTTIGDIMDGDTDGVEGAATETPERPAGVPPDAVWDAEAEEWVAP